MQRAARIGIDLGGTKIEGILLDPDGGEARRLRRSTPRDDYDATLGAIRTLVADLEGDTSGATVGVATPGAISPATGLLKNANSTWLNGRRFDEDLARALDRPVRIANDANCFALSEATDGAGANAHVVFGVIIGTGAGGGLVIDGKPILGANAIGGEWGHNPLPWPRADEIPGPVCYCGQNGCLETYLSGPGLTRDHAERAGDCLSPPEIVEAARAGDAAAVATMGRYHHRAARGLAMVINIVDPDVIVLGGGLSLVDTLYDEIPRHWTEFVFSDRIDTRLRRPVHGDASGVRGAAWLW